MATLKKIFDIYEKLELELITAMHDALKIKSKTLTPAEFERWQASEQTRLKRLQRKSDYILKKYRKQLRTETKRTFMEIYTEYQDKEIKRMIRNYGKTERFKKSLQGLTVDNLHGFDERRLMALISSINNDLDKSTVSVLRTITDEYRAIVSEAALEYNAGQKTLTRAIDDAQTTFLSKGITSITYTSGAVVNIRSYAEMALRTSGQRARIEAEASVRDYLGIYTVRVSHHSVTCDKCRPWQGMVLIDDVYQHGTPDGKHKLLSQAVEAGLLHPNCRHSLLTVVPELDGEDIKYTYTAADAENYKAQQKQRKLERDLRRYKRLEAGTLDPTKKSEYRKKRIAKSREINDFVESNDFLIRQREREKI